MNIVSDFCAGFFGLLLALAILWRFQPSGKLASGDALDWDADKSKVVYFQGMFLQIITLILLLAICLVGYSEWQERQAMTAAKIKAVTA